MARWLCAGGPVTRLEMMPGKAESPRPESMLDAMDTGNSAPLPPRPRRGCRIAVNAEVILRRSGQINYRVRIFDASPFGCKVEFVERPALDEMLWVKFEGLEPLASVVCWICGATAGLEFAKPIHPAVFDTLLARVDPFHG